MKDCIERRSGRFRAACLLVAVAAMTTGCAQFSQDHGFDVVAARSRTQLQADVLWPRSADEAADVARRVDSLLLQPLQVTDAVDVALLNNRGLRARFAELQISEAALVESGRVPNPRFDFLHTLGAGQYDIEESLSLNVLSLLTMPWVYSLEKVRFAQVQEGLVLEVARLAAETRSAYYTALTAQALLTYRREVESAAAASAVLAERMQRAGNWSDLDRARQREFQVDASLQLDQALLAADAANEALARLLNATPATLRLAERLPDMPASAEALPDVERALLENRIDLRQQRTQLDELARRLKLTTVTRWISLLEAGPARVKDGAAGQPYEHGYRITLEIPIFDSGAPRRQRAEGLYRAAADAYAQAVIDARSQIRHAYVKYQTRFELARRQRDEALPLRQAILQQDLLRYNASLISVFELLADAREQSVSVAASIESTRDFWLAKSELDATLLGH